MSKLIEVNIWNPLGIMFKKKAAMILLPALDGEIGVLSNHIPMILSLKFGLIKLFSDDGKMLASFYLDSGVAKISSLDVNILCGQCCDAANIDEAYLHKQIDLLSKPDNKNSKLEFYKNILAVI
jgi:F-type H+-transporting ATPase subunit epsilon